MGFIRVINVYHKLQSLYVNYQVQPINYYQIEGPPTGSAHFVCPSTHGIQTHSLMAKFKGTNNRRPSVKQMQVLYKSGALRMTISIDVNCPCEMHLSALCIVSLLFLLLGFVQETTANSSECCLLLN